MGADLASAVLSPPWGAPANRKHDTDDTQGELEYGEAADWHGRVERGAGTAS